VYVQRGVYDKFMQALVAKTNEMVKIGDPLKKDTFLGPLVNQGAYDDYKRFVDLAKRDGKVVLGGEVLTDGEQQYGYYVTPTIIESLPQDHELVQTELFVPILAALPYDTLEEALAKANDVDYGLTAGIF